MSDDESFDVTLSSSEEEEEDGDVGSSADDDDGIELTVSSTEGDPEAVAANLKDLNVSPSQLAQYTQMFYTFDADGSGQIAARELKQVMRSIGQSAAAADLQVMLELADKNANGRIDLYEFVYIMELASKFRYKQLVDAFTVFDEDENGSITKEEFYSTLLRLGLKVEAEARETMFKRADTDKNGLIDLAEFLAVLKYQGQHYSADELDVLKELDVEEVSLLYSSDEEESLDVSDAVAPMDPNASVSVNVIHFYTDERWRIDCRASVRVSDFVSLVADKTGEPTVKLRLYHEGFLMRKDQTLFEHGVGNSSTVWLVYDYIRDRMDTALLYDEDGTPNLPNLYKHFRGEGLLKRKDAVDIIKQATALMDVEPNVLTVEDPCIVVGDIHGQYFDLAELFEVVGEINGKYNWVFLGDYVDRGAFSAECYLFLLAAKVKYPNKIHLLRGNHESVKQNEVCGSMIEFINKYGDKCYHYIAKSYYVLPLAAIVKSGGHRFLCCHGGLSPDVATIDDYNSIDRKHEVPRKGPLKVTLWSDPFRDTETLAPWPTKFDLKNLKAVKGNTPSAFNSKSFHESERGPDVLSYGHPAVVEFLKANNLVSVIRGHEQKKFGYEMYRAGGEYNFPSIITIFSAPNYTDKSLNLGAVGRFRKGKFEVLTYKWRNHPQYFPSTTSKNTPHPHSCEKCLQLEDFIQFVHWLHPDSLTAMPIRQLRMEYKDMFEMDIRRRDAKAIVGSEGEAALDDQGENWEVIGKNLLEVLQLSKKSEIRKRYRKRSTAMLMWYSGYDHFYAAVKEESEYEMDSGEAADFDVGSLSKLSSDKDSDEEDGTHTKGRKAAAAPKGEASCCASCSIS